MLKLSDNHLYETQPEVYEALSDYVNENIQVPVTRTEPQDYIDADFDDCFVDDEQNFWMPSMYDVLYVGTAEDDNLTSFAPVYNTKPTLTKLEIANLVALAEEPELNDPARNI